MKICLPTILSVFIFFAVTGCESDEPLPPATSTTTETPQDQLVLFENALRTHVPVLASDEFAGRAPATPGEEKTINYLREQFAATGARPGNNNRWFQDVPVTQITVSPDTALRITGDRGDLALQYGEQMMASTQQQVEQTGITNSELVFVGYGIVAPEYNWNDYAGVDVTGKTVVMLVNDPGYATQDKNLFTGTTMTYYGRWTYKYEEAARQGAAGAIIIHETGAAGYPWEVVTGSWSGTQVALAANDRNLSRSSIEAWITSDAARTLFTLAGLDYQQMIIAAARRDFKPVPMNLQANIQLQAKIRHSQTRNVLALIPGTETPGEVIIYTAHWDHLGTNPDLEGDTIYNGALDNATGIAGLIGLAESFMNVSPPPKRSILFLATTSEESGLLGSEYYARHPAFPVKKTAAALNMDSLNIFGPTKDVTIIGYGNSELDRYVTEAAEKQGRRIVAEDSPEKGLYYRSDHFNMAKVGIPALYAKSGIDSVEHGPEWGKKQKEEYTSERYHKPSDEWNPNWDLRGAAQDLQLYFDVGYRLSMEDSWPAWSADSEFKAAREKSLQN